MNENELFDHIKKLYDKHDTDYLSEKILLDELKKLGLNEKEVDEILSKAEAKNIIESHIEPTNEARGELGYMLVTKEYTEAMEKQTKKWFKQGKL